MESIQINKYKQCLMNVNINLGILIQNAENLAYKLGVIKAKNLQYNAYDFYNQYDIKNIMTLRKNIISSLKFLKAQFIAIKEDTQKEYIYPPSIDKIIGDIKKWKEEISKINPPDVKYYTAILEILETKKYKDIKGSNEVYKICNKDKKSDITPYMWMFIAPPLLNHIDKEHENSNLLEGKGTPELVICNKVELTYNQNLIESNKNYIEQKEINEILRNYTEKDYNRITFKLLDFSEKNKYDPYIEKENKNIFKKIIENEPLLKNYLNKDEEEEKNPMELEEDAIVQNLSNKNDKINYASYPDSKSTRIISDSLGGNCYSKTIKNYPKINIENKNKNDILNEIYSRKEGK